ncbi:phosphate regulon transcriptional regulator PhoB [Rhodoferax sp.]|uniref:phosphate regulon transcriptional regulator PhoB n=1 Tax=Rhodoferax sp. TaxID=50421 RepID=UPI002721B453|nr:phosphate regulon transcriptional regulator PhoB [Rhodoferax sp.]MDO9196993.1 phosphate regulon transcriptional regulator PhoB [Rhodoferax sp.]
MAAQILVVEDNPDIQELIVVNLRRAGHIVQCAVDAEAAHGLARAAVPDLMLIDWMLPGMSGIDLARMLRSDSRTRDVSIIMLTARDEERDKITGLEAGADDYMTKPFSPRELLARITAVLRRRVPQATEGSVEIGGIRLDPAAQRVTAAGAELALGPTEFRLLHFFMTHADRVYSRAQLLSQVWGDQFFGEERTVDVHIRRLRAAMEEGGHDALIQTVRGSGYSFSARAR